MEQNPAASRRPFWHPALPYALDYLGLVLATAYLSILWFTGRLNSLYLSIPLGIAFTTLAGIVFYRWQHGRWLRRKNQLELTALQLWLADHLLNGTTDDFRKLTCDLLTTQDGYTMIQEGKHPLLKQKGHTYRLLCLRRHPACPADAQLLMQLASAFQDYPLMVVSTASCTDSARDYAQRQGIQLLSPLDLASLAQRADIRLPDRHRSCYMDKACREHQHLRKSFLNRLSQTRALRYLSGAVLLGLMGILSPWRGWYWLTALYCAIMGAAGWLSLKGKRADRS